MNQKKREQVLRRRTALRERETRLAGKYLGLMRALLKARLEARWCCVGLIERAIGKLRFKFAAARARVETAESALRRFRKGKPCRSR